MLQTAYLLLLFTRFGLLATTATFVFSGIGQYYAMPLDPSASWISDMIRCGRSVL